LARRELRQALPGCETGLANWLFSNIDEPIELEIADWLL
jgi:hypothetical protein